MALSIGSLIAFLKTDTREFDRGFQSAEKTVKDVAKRFESLTKAATVAAGALAGLGGLALKAASDFGEVADLAKDAFGEQRSQEVLKWSKDVGEAMGRSSVQMFEAATNMQALLLPMVGSRDKAEEMSKAFARLAVDMGSAFNVADKDALAALRSGMSGESEPLKKFGVIMSENALKAFAAEKGIRGYGAGMDEATKAMVRAQFILEKTTLAQGNAEKTSGSFANQLKRLKGQTEDLAVTVGQVLLPPALALVTRLNELVKRFQELSTEQKNAIIQKVILAAKIIFVVAAVGQLTQAAATMINVFRGIASIYPLVARLTLQIVTLSATQQQAAASAFIMKAAIKDAASTSFASLQKQLGIVSFVLKGLTEDAGTMGPLLFKAFAPAAAAAWAFLAPLLAVAAAVVGVILLAGALRLAWVKDLGGIATFSKAAWETITSHVREWMKGTLEFVRIVVRVAALAFEQLAQPFIELGKIVGGKLGEMAHAVEGVLKDIKTMVGEDFVDNVVTTFADMGRDAAEMFNTGIEGVVYGVSESFKSAGEIVKGFTKDMAINVPVGVEPSYGPVDNPEYRTNFLKGANPENAKEDEKAAKAKAKEEKKALKEFQKAVEESAKRWEKANSTNMAGVQTVQPKGIGTDGNVGPIKLDPGFLNKSLREADKRFEKGLATAVAGFGAALGASFLDAAGGLRTVIDAAVAGFASAGPVGAIAGVFAALLSQSEGFATLATMAGNAVKMAADVIGAVLEPFQSLLAALSLLVNGALRALAPVFELVAMLVEPLVPPLMILGDILTALAPVIGIVAKAFLLISQPIMLLAGPLMKGLFQVLKGAGIVILKFIQLVAPLWNGIVGAFEAVFRKLSEIEVFGAKPFGFMEDWANGLRSAIIDTDDLAEAERNLSKSTWDSTQARAAEHAEVLKGTEAKAKETAAVERATAAMINVPRGFKVALTRFNSIALDPKDMAAPTYTGGGSGAAHTPVDPAKAAMTAMAQGGAAGRQKSGGKIPDWLKKAMGLENIPGLASGGVARKSTLALIGEGREPEAVIPLSRLDSMLENGGGDGGGDTLNFYITINADGDAEKIYRQILKIGEREKNRRSGFTGASSKFLTR